MQMPKTKNFNKTVKVDRSVFAMLLWMPNKTLGTLCQTNQLLVANFIYSCRPLSAFFEITMLIIHFIFYECCTVKGEINYSSNKSFLWHFLCNINRTCKKSFIGLLCMFYVCT